MYVILDSDILKEHEDHYTMKGPLPESLIPATLQDLLFAKLDQLGKAKEIAQIAAVFGRELDGRNAAVISALESEHSRTFEYTG
jgi:predicted ATPase